MARPPRADRRAPGRSTATAPATSTPTTATCRSTRASRSSSSTARSGARSSRPSARRSSRCASAARSATTCSGGSSATSTSRSCGWRPEGRGQRPSALSTFARLVKYGSRLIWRDHGAARRRRRGMCRRLRPVDEIVEADLAGHAVLARFRRSVDRAASQELAGRRIARQSLVVVQAEDREIEAVEDVRRAARGYCSSHSSPLTT